MHSWNLGLWDRKVLLAFPDLLEMIFITTSTVVTSLYDIKPPFGPFCFFVFFSFPSPPRLVFVTNTPWGRHEFDTIVLQCVTVIKTPPLLITKTMISSKAYDSEIWNNVKLFSDGASFWFWFIINTRSAENQFKSSYWGSLFEMSVQSSPVPFVLRVSHHNKILHCLIFLSLHKRNIRKKKTLRETQEVERGPSM